MTRLWLVIRWTDVALSLACLILGLTAMIRLGGKLRRRVEVWFTVMLAAYFIPATIRDVFKSTAMEHAAYLIYGMAAVASSAALIKLIRQDERDLVEG